MKIAEQVQIYVWPKGMHHSNLSDPITSWWLGGSWVTMLRVWKTCSKQFILRYWARGPQRLLPKSSALVVVSVGHCWPWLENHWSKGFAYCGLASWRIETFIFILWNVINPRTLFGCYWSPEWWSIIGQNLLKNYWKWSNSRFQN